jgi:hypothetical protein
MTKIMLDSGAFTVWTKGARIDLDSYIEFCLAHPQVDVYINLDVIPGSPKVSKPPTPQEVDDCAKETWKNYLKMIRRLPIEKVMGVYHQGESMKWLERYLDFKAPYVGLGNVAMAMEENRLAWFRSVRSMLMGSDGKAVTKLHGLGVTSFRSMKAMPWYSVDSASWIRSASYGTVYVPMMRKGEPQYDVSPFLLNVSPKSPSVDDWGKHITTLSPTLRKQVLDYFATLKMPLGSFEEVAVPKGYKRQSGEYWTDKTKTKIYRTVVMGLSTDHHRRFWTNARFIRRANEVLPIVDIYFAGAPGSTTVKVEDSLGRRLFSYHDVSKESTKSYRTFCRHIELKGVAA